MSAIRRCVRELLNRRGVDSATAKRALCSGGERTEEVKDKDLFITKAEVTRFMVDCMVATKTPVPNAERLAANLLAADYRGHFSHGLNRLAMYVKDIESGNCDPSAEPTVLKESAATAWVDGNNGLGVVVGEFSMKLAISKAKDSGVGWVTAKRSNHFGICQWYTDMALEEGLIGMSATNTSPLVAPTRAKEQVLGTNPFCVSAPASRPSDRYLLDMSTSAVAVGKIEMQLRKGEPLPSRGWALGRDGSPTVDSHEAFFDGMGNMPLGGEEINSGYKGYGLGMFVELLCGLTSGSMYAHKVRRWTEHHRPADLGHFFLAVDPDCFAPGMKDRLQDLMDHIRGLEPVDPRKPVLVPGDPERLAMEHVDRVGAIKYTPDHITSYRKLAGQLNVVPMKPFNG